MNIIITDKDVKKINYCLNKMVSSSMAHSVLLIDRSGQLIAHHGNTPEIDILSLSALTAANFGATAEIARMLGEEEFTLLFHKGRYENVYFSPLESMSSWSPFLMIRPLWGWFVYKLIRSLTSFQQFFHPSLKKEGRN